MLKNVIRLSLIVPMTFVALVSCSNDSIDDSVMDYDESEVAAVTELHAAFAAFNPDATTIYLDGSKVVIETTGLPNHESVYWGEGSSLYRAEPDVDTTPSIMSSNNNATSITVDATPDLTGNTVDT